MSVYVAWPKRWKVRKLPAASSSSLAQAPLSLPHCVRGQVGKRSTGVGKVHREAGADIVST